jgi:hypothetical protein
MPGSLALLGMTEPVSTRAKRTCGVVVSRACVTLDEPLGPRLRGGDGRCFRARCARPDIAVGCASCTRTDVSNSAAAPPWTCALARNWIPAGACPRGGGGGDDASAANRCAAAPRALGPMRRVRRLRRFWGRALARRWIAVCASRNRDDASAANRCAASPRALGPMRRVRRLHRLWGRALARRWIPAFAGMTHPSPLAARLRLLLADGCFEFSGSAGSGGGRLRAIGSPREPAPAEAGAGMTHPSPLAARLRLLLADGCVTFPRSRRL